MFHTYLSIKQEVTSKSLKMSLISDIFSRYFTNIFPHTSLASEGSDDVNLHWVKVEAAGVEMAKFLECKFVGLSRDFLLLHEG